MYNLANESSMYPQQQYIFTWPKARVGYLLVM